jgi:hypothetical protein
MHTSGARLAQVAWLMLLASTFSRADDLKTTNLQQDVLELQRLVRQQQQHIEALERQAGGRPPVSTTAAPGVARTIEVPANWLNESDWERVRPGTSELEVIRILGVPSSLRKSADGAQRVLYYALEIGTGGFLSGSVTIADHKVVAVEKPTIK